MEFEKGSMLRAEAGDERKDRRKEKHADGKADALPECAALAHDKQGIVCRTVRLNRERETVRKPAQHPPHKPYGRVLGQHTREKYHPAVIRRHTGSLRFSYWKREPSVSRRVIVKKGGKATICIFHGT